MKVLYNIYMTKIGFISDLHLKVHKSSEAFLPHILKTLDHFDEECKARDIKYVFMLGDIFHVKNVISTYTQNEALKALKKIMKKYSVHLIPGNHDILSKGDTSINSLKIFEDSCNFYEDYSQLKIDDNTFHFLPYFNDSLIVNKIKNIKLNSGKNFLCSHLGLRGFLLDNHHEDIYSDLEVKDIDVGFDKIFTGHYHSHQIKGKVCYISSPYESHFGDEGNHGFVFFDTKTENIEFLENKLSPRFISIELNASNYDKINSLTNSFIKLIIKKHIDNSLLLKYKEKLLKNNFDVQFNFDIASSSAKISVAKDWEHFISESPEEILTSYINDNSSLPNDFNKSELLEYIGI